MQRTEHPVAAISAAPCHPLLPDHSGGAFPASRTAMELRRIFAIRRDAQPTIALAVQLLYTTGMRVAELTALSVGDIDLKRRTLRVRGKGNRERQVFLTSTEVVTEIRAFLGLVQEPAT